MHSVITQLAAQAWENVCARFDFEKAATRLGMRMTIDGSGDQFICVQGVREYSFCDADGGEVGKESDEEGNDPEEHAVLNADVQVDSSDEEQEGEQDEADAAEDDAAAAGKEDADSSDYEGGELDSSSEEEDDTAAQGVADLIGSAVAPDGWTIDEVQPPLNSELEMNELIGKNILYGHDSKKAQGWFIGTIQSRNLSPTDLKKTPTANFVVEYHAKLTDKKLVGKVACELSARTWGPKEWWVLVQKDEVAGPSGVGGQGGGRGSCRGKRGRGQGRKA
jgi:hypothetical protein